MWLLYQVEFGGPRGRLVQFSSIYHTSGCGYYTRWSLAVQGAVWYSLERRDDSFSGNGGISSSTVASVSVDAMFESLRYSIDLCCSSWSGFLAWWSDCRTWGGRRGGGRYLLHHCLARILILASKWGEGQANQPS